MFEKLRLVQFLLWGLLFSKIRANDKPEPKIIIVGAGPAGLAAGAKLLEYGFKDIQILEAESRFGGRIHTVPFGDNVIDLGAQWCHGQEHNVVYEMVHALNLLNSSASTFTQFKLSRTNGEQIEDSIAQRLKEIVDLLREQRGEYGKENETALDFFKNEFNKSLEKSENKDIDKILANEFFMNFLNDESCYESANSLAEIPAQGDTEYEREGGDLLLNWKDKGYKQFLKFLLKTDESGDEFGILKNHLKLGVKVKLIEWQRTDLKIRILCEDGVEILADHVIVTVSLGVLKAQYKKLFDPTLPQQKQNAIENINFGSAAKIFIEFEKSFWPANWYGSCILWRKEDLMEIRNTEKAWLEGISVFHVVDYQPRLLEGWVYGNFARQMEALKLDVVRNDTLAVLQRSLPWDLSNIIDFTITNWCSNPNFRGTYSYHSMNMKRSGAKPRDFEEPLKVKTLNFEPGQDQRPVVLFAGEATNTKHFATVHGAVETGWREAKRLANFYGFEVEKEKII